VLFLAKPYTMEELLSKVRQAMDREESPETNPLVSRKAPKRP
jgi:hypothetical protein